jgi:hypothetical protein
MKKLIALILITFAFSSCVTTMKQWKTGDGMNTNCHRQKHRLPNFN